MAVSYAPQGFHVNSTALPHNSPHTTRRCRQGLPSSQNAEHKARCKQEFSETAERRHSAILILNLKYNSLMARRAISLVLFFLSLAAAYSQDPRIDPEANVDPAMLHTWLHSGDPRLIAWAADFARRRHELALISEIPGLLEHWSMPPMAGGYQEQAAQRSAVLALLDAIIQENVQVPIPVIRRIFGEFPAQALLQIQRHPLEKSRSTLMDWAFPADSPIVSMRSRAAAMILASHPNPDLTYTVLKSLAQHVTIHIVPNGAGFGAGFSTSCGDSSPIPPTPGWPVVYAYSLFERSQETGSESKDTIPIARLGSHSIHADRYDENRGGGGCWTPQSDAAFRHELIAYWLGIKTNDMKWQPEESLDVVWTTKAAYERQVGAFLEEDRVRMLGTRHQLLGKGLLDEHHIDSTFPQITIRIECDISPCPLPPL